MTTTSKKEAVSKGGKQALVLAYAGCTTCKNALKWLAAEKIDHRVRPIVDEPPTKEELATWIDASGLPVRKWLNTSGQSFRAIGKAKIDAATDAQLVSWLAADGKLVKRPVLVRDGTVLVGFKPEQWGDALR
jgi:arsenate reductase